MVTAVGTDGTAPDRTFDLFKDMRMAMTMERLRFTDPWRLPPGKALEMVTIDAARALRLDREMGSLEPGKKADVILVAMRAPHLVPNVMPVHRIVYEATGHDVDTVIVDGTVLMRGRRVLSVDESRTLDFAEDQARLAFERAGVQPLMEIPENFWGRSRYAPARIRARAMGMDASHVNRRATHRGEARRRIRSWVTSGIEAGSGRPDGPRLR